MDRIEIRVAELDCAEEAKILKQVVGKTSGIEKIDFDVVGGTMQISFDPTKTTSKILLEAVQKAGMKGQLTTDRPGAPTFWEKRGRLFLCVLSGLFLFVGFVMHLFGPEPMAEVSGFKAQFDHPSPLLIFFYAMAIVTGGWFVAPKALASIRRVRPDMNLLMLVAVVGAIAIGQWFEAAAVTFLFSLALLLESWSVDRARSAIGALLDLSPKVARVLGEKGMEEIPVENVAVGQRILVRPGERIPLDGRVASGISHVDQAPITGESMPMQKSPSDPVYAGTINGAGALEVLVEKGSKDTTLAHIIDMVQEARAKRGKSEQWVDRFAQVYTPIMILFALAFVLIPPLAFGASWIDWIYRGLVLLVIACPCALVISTPVTIVSALTAAAREGVLIKGGIYLEAAAQLKALAFDKTGTVTAGKPAVQKIIPMNGHSEKELIEIAARLEKPSEHPLARAILDRAEEWGIDPKAAEDFQIFQGLGAEGTTEEGRFWIGSHRFMHEAKRKESPEAHEQALALEDAGHSVVAIGDFSHICGLISVSDSARPKARELIEELHSIGIEKVAMLTGDNQKTAELLAEEVGIDVFFAELLPEDKVQAIEELKREHRFVGMVGDGVNDAPALAASSLGIAMGAMGTDVAFETADVVLMEDNLSRIPWLIRQGRRALRVVRQNVIFSLAVKLLFITLALFGLATLWMAIAADTGASLLVVFNGLRLLRRKDGNSRQAG